MRTRGHGPRTEAAAKALGLIGEYGAVWLAIGVALAVADGDRREQWLAAGILGPVAIGINFAVKVGVGRQRPLIEEHPPLARAPTKLSVPSAHATSSLAAATALGRVSPGGRPVLYGLAAAICASRPYLGMHYPSDVLAGAVLGATLGRIVPGLDGDRAAASAVPATSP
jgi:membrane-associated phospholipid phosphatase